MEISIWSVAAASVVAFIIGSVWYSPLMFGKEWMSLVGITDADVATAQARGMTRPYFIQLVITGITFIVIAFAIQTIGAYTARDGAFIALIAWIGFIIPGALGGMLWEKKPFKLVLINSVSTLLSWVVGGAIIGGWQ